MQQENFQVAKKQLAPFVSKKILFIFILFFCFEMKTSDASLRFKSEQQEDVSREKNKVKNVEKANPENQKAELVKLGLENSNQEQVLKSLHQLEVILNQEKKFENILAIEFNRIICYIQLARLNRIKSGGKTLVKDEEDYLKKAMLLIDKLMKIEKITAKDRGQLYYFQGICFLDLGLKEKSRQSFETSIEIYPEARYTPSLSLYLADLLYDEEQLDQALIGYKRFYSAMNSYERDLSDYKTAWIYLNQSKIENAIDLFLKLISTSTSSSIVQDAIISGGVALNERYNQDEIVKKINGSSFSDDKKLKLFWVIYENLLNQPTKEREKIWKEILNLENKGESIARVISLELQYITTELKFKTDDYVKAEYILKYLNLNKNKIKGFEKIVQTNLGLDLERVISSALTNFQKVKNEFSYKFLLMSIESYLKVDVFDRTVEVMTLYLDLLSENNETSKIIDQSKIILDDPRFKVIHDKTKTLLLTIYEKKYKENPKEIQNIFFRMIDDYLSDSKAEQWESVANKYYEYLVKLNMFPKAEEVAMRLLVLKKGSNFDNYLLKVISVKFEQKKCNDILNYFNKKNNFDGKYSEYIRECHLILAQEAKKSKNSFTIYQKNILEFIKFSEGSKKNAAIVDYLRSLKENSNQKEVFDELLFKTYFPMRFEKEIFSFYEQEILELIDRGDLDKANALLADCTKNSSCASLGSIASQIDQVILLDDSLDLFLERLFNYQNNSQSVKFISLLRPLEFLHFVLDKNLMNNINPNILLVATRAGQIDWNDSRYLKLCNKLGLDLNKEERTYTCSHSKSYFEKILFPANTKQHKLNDQTVLGLMKKVQASRDVVLKDLTNYSEANQKLILENAIELENKMAEVIMSSPMPKSLQKDKYSEYKNGLMTVAKEFNDQVLSYQKAIQALEGKGSSLRTIQDSNKEFLAKNYAHLLKQIDYSLWKWSGPKVNLEIIKKNTVEKKWARSLFYLDYLLGLSKISKEDYYYYRATVLLFSGLNRKMELAILSYVKDELTLNQLEFILNNWNTVEKK